MTFLCEFDPETPEHCPPNDARHEDTVVFRMTRRVPASPEDFEPDVVAQPEKADPTVCQHWGCSVWRDEEAVRHALKLFKFFSKNHVVEARIAANDGVIKKTPTNRQPGHYTFWKGFGVEITGPFSLVYSQGTWT